MASPPASGQQIAAREQQHVEPARGGDPERDGERGQRDAELEQAVDEHRAGDPLRITSRQRRAGSEPAHVGGEHRGDGQLRGSEHERELARPGGLVDQRGQAGEKEAEQQQQKGAIARHGFSSDRAGG